MVIVGLPWMALGLEHTIVLARRLFERRAKLSSRAAGTIALCAIAVAVAGSLLDGPMSAVAHMQKHAAVGRWIYQRAGPEPALAGNLDHLSIDTFFSHGHMVGIFWPRHCLIVPMPAAITQRRADVVVLWNEDNIDAKYLPLIEERIAYCGYRRVDAKELPASENELMVFLRK